MRNPSNPGLELLERWSHRRGATLRVLMRNLERMGRQDLALVLQNIMLSKWGIVAY